MEGWNQPDSVVYSGYVQHSNYVQSVVPAYSGNVPDVSQSTLYDYASATVAQNGVPSYNMNYDSTNVPQYSNVYNNSVGSSQQPVVNSADDQHVGEISKIQKLPDELMKMFKTNFCELCMAKMNSTVQVEMHYKGKQHFKKQFHWLVVYNRGHGLPPPKKNKPEGQQKPKPVDLSMAGKVGPIPECKERTFENPEMYCKICDLTFTSFEHADQHYKGRKHQRVSEGKVPPKTGYFNKFTQKWQRNPPEETHPRQYHKLKAKLDKRKRKHGEAVTTSEEASESQPPKKFPKTSKSLDMKSLISMEYEVDLRKLPKAVPSAVVSEKAPPKTEKPPSSRFYCSVCQVTLNSKIQLNIHKESKRHQNNLKKS